MEGRGEGWRRGGGAEKGGRGGEGKGKGAGGGMAALEIRGRYQPVDIFQVKIADSTVAAADGTNIKKNMKKYDGIKYIKSLESGKLRRIQRAKKIKNKKYTKHFQRKNKARIDEEGGGECKNSYIFHHRIKWCC